MGAKALYLKKYYTLRAALSQGGFFLYPPPPLHKIRQLIERREQLC